MLEIKNITFSYNQKNVVENISLSVADGEHVAVIGESGCGKSTLLKLIYGILDADSGSLFYNHHLIRGPKFKLIPGEDQIKYLAQDFGLMPFITVAENVGKYLSNINKIEKMRRVEDLLELVELTEYSNVKAKNLSGGQQQRTALAMALALEPKLLLLDEPFSQIDAFRTNMLRRAVFGYCKLKNISVVIATHDSKDILPYADKVVVLRDGKIVQSGSSHEVYTQPASVYCASLFGEVSEVPNVLLGIDPPEGTTLLYPHQLVRSAEGFAVEVYRSQFNGSHYLIEATANGGQIFFTDTESFPAGTKLTISLKK